MSKIDALAKQGIFYTPLEDPKPAGQEDGDFVRGVKKAAYQIPQTLGGTAALVGDLTGADGLRDYGMGVYQKNTDKIDAITKPSDSLTSVLEGDGNAIDWAQNAAGYVGGQAVTALLTGGAGGFIGSQLAKRGIREVVARGAESAIAKQVAENAAAKGAKMGAVAALGTNNLAQEAGSIYPDAVQQAKDDGRTLDAGDKARIVGSAIGAAAVDTGMDAFMGHRILAGGRRAVIDSTGKPVVDATGHVVMESMGRAARREVPGMMAKEAATEGIQTVMERYGAGQPLTTADAVRDYVDSMGVGAVGGGLGGAVSVLQAHKVPVSGPLTRAADVSIDAQVAGLQTDPSPLVTHPDGSVSHKADIEAALSTIADPAAREAERNRLMGLDETGAPIEAEAPPPPTAAATPADEKAALEQWGAKHEPVTLKYAQALLKAPGAKGQDLMIAPHPDGGGFTVVPSNILTLDTQTRAAALQSGPDGVMMGEKSADAKTDKAVTEDERLASKRALYNSFDETGAPADVVAARVLKYQEKANQAGTPMNLWRSKNGSIGFIPSNQESPFADGELVTTVHPDEGKSSASAPREARKPAAKAEEPMAAVDMTDTQLRTKLDAIKKQAIASGGFTKQFVEPYQVLQDEVRRRAIANGDPIMNKEGKPFASEFAAKNALRAGLADTHEITKADDTGGFVLTPKTADKPQAKPSTTPAPQLDLLDAAAHEAATSPKNDLPEPTDGQKDAGNYKKGHLSLHGLDISIENPAGSVRSGVDRSGAAWKNTLKHHYGYIKKTLGADGDHVDAFIGPNPGSGKAFVIDQIHPEDGKFDEHKIILGANSLDEARAIYKANYAKGWKGGKDVTETSVEGLKTWLNEGDTTKPFAPQDAPAASSHAETVAKPAETATEGAKSATEAAPAAPAAPPAAAAADQHVGEKFASAQEARAYLTSNKITDTHRAEQTGREEFTIKSKVAEPSGAARLAAGQEKHAKQDDAVRKAAENIAKRQQAKENQAAAEEKSSKQAEVPAGNDAPVIPSGNEVEAQAVEHDTGADIPLAFYKKVKVPVEVWIEDEKAFETVDMPAHKALASAREDIASLQALLNCLKG